MIKAVIFDFDGVIVESADIKTSAFRKLFEGAHPDKADTIVDYHMRNMGISRFVKFRYIYKNILQMPLSIKDEQKLGDKFAELVLEEVLKAPFVPGALEFLKTNKDRYGLFIASGTPEEELHDILKRRKLKGFFKEAHGAPKEKAGIISDILKDHSLGRDEVLFVGDAESDRSASEDAGVRFIARLTSANNSRVEGCEWKIRDLTELDDLIKRMGF